MTLIGIPEEHSDDWWGEAFPTVAYERKPPGAKEMLVLIAYDVSDPRRLKKVATVCEEFGTRVQYSLFECHLKESELVTMWDQLMELIDPEEDRIVAYRLDSRSARRTLTAGTMICSSRVVCYLV